MGQFRYRRLFALGIALLSIGPASKAFAVASLVTALSGSPSLSGPTATTGASSSDTVNAAGTLSQINANQTIGVDLAGLNYTINVNNPLVQSVFNVDQQFVYNGPGSLTGNIKGNTTATFSNPALITGGIFDVTGQILNAGKTIVQSTFADFNDPAFVTSRAEVWNVSGPIANLTAGTTYTLREIVTVTMNASGPSAINFASDYQASVSPVPEPSSLALMGLGVGCVFGIARQRRRSVVSLGATAGAPTGSV